jgi:hypothetical protein
MLDSLKSPLEVIGFPIKVKGCLKNICLVQYVQKCYTADMKRNRLAVCRAMTKFGTCNNVFTPRGDGEPALFICPECEDRINYGIKRTLHIYTGNTKGNFSNQPNLGVN